ncbi:MAG: ATP-dependent dethiobiotin synthetase BioD [Porphyrobacter sp.]|nr:ATP-dependent dethiobiotin synthetase BioD [Porphyrobacter sp.]
MRLVVSGTDTGIGKTVLAGAIAQAVGATYWKPIQAGLDEETDSERAAALGLRTLPEVYRLKTPCSPHRAAEIDGVTIDDAALALPEGEDRLVIEGAGGVLVPIRDDLLFADLFARWGLPVVLAARTALGTINHTLLSIEALRARGVPILGVAFVGDAVENTEATIARIGRVKRLGRLPMLPEVTADAVRTAFTAAFDVRDFM